jgi:hypothetical protein
VADGSTTEQARQRFLTGFVQVVLIAKEDDLVREPRGSYCIHGLRVEVGGQPDAPDLGADTPADRNDVDGTLA